MELTRAQELLYLEEMYGDNKKASAASKNPPIEEPAVIQLSTSIRREVQLLRRSRRESKKERDEILDYMEI